MPTTPALATPMAVSRSRSRRRGSVPFGGGRGGTLAVRAETLTVTGGARLSASTFDAGAAGGIRIEAGDLGIRGTAQTASILGSADLGSSGDAASVSIEAHRLELRSGGEIRSSTFGGGDGGSVQVEADHLLITGRGLGGGGLRGSGDWRAEERRAENDQNGAADDDPSGAPETLGHPNVACRGEAPRLGPLVSWRCSLGLPYRRRQHDCR